jgi:hypothetical protein
MAAATTPTTTVPGRVRVSQLRVGDRIRWGTRVARIASIEAGRVAGHVVLTNEYGQNAEVRAGSTIERQPAVVLTGAA